MYFLQQIQTKCAFILKHAGSARAGPGHNACPPSLPRAPSSPQVSALSHAAPQVCGSAKINLREARTGSWVAPGHLSNKATRQRLAEGGLAITGFSLQRAQTGHLHWLPAAKHFSSVVNGTLSQEGPTQPFPSHRANPHLEPEETRKIWRLLVCFYRFRWSTSRWVLFLSQENSVLTQPLSPSPTGDPHSPGDTLGSISGLKPRPERRSEAL